MLETSLHDMSAPVRGSKRSGSVMKVTTLGAPHTKKKRRLNWLDKKRGRGRVGDTQSQVPVSSKTFTRILETMYMRQRGTKNMTDNDSGV